MADAPLTDQLLEALAATEKATEAAVGSLPRPWPPVPNPSQRTLATMTLTNSLSLYRSALTLAQAEAYGHAGSLLVLSLEEAAKAMALRFLSLGVFSSDPQVKGRRPYIEEEALWCHRCKQSIVGALLMGPASLALFGFTDAWFEERSKAVTEAELVADPSRLVGLVPPLVPPARSEVEARLKESPELAESMRRTLVLVRSLNQRKLRGLYVDLEAGEGFSPLGFSHDEFASLAALTRDMVGPLIPLVGGQPPPEIERALTHLGELPLPPTVIECSHRGKRKPRRRSPNLGTPSSSA